jgi:uncharacterized protein YlxW (UPF0749 family)
MPGAPDTAPDTDPPQPPDEPATEAVPPPATETPPEEAAAAPVAPVAPVSAEPVSAEPVSAEPVSVEPVSVEPADEEPVAWPVAEDDADDFAGSDDPTMGWGAGQMPEPEEPDEEATEPLPAAPAPAKAKDSKAKDSKAKEASAGTDPVAVPAATPDTVTRRKRVSAAGMVIGLLLGLLGFAFVAQIDSKSDQQLSSARPEDLVRILSDLDSRKDRLQQEITTLEGTQQQLALGTEGRQAALNAATKRAADLGILAGTVPAMGPGITVTFKPGNQGLKASLILDAIEELRDAGAEAMQIQGNDGMAVRIVASTSFIDGTGGMVVDGRQLTGSYLVTVIGEPSTMQTALNIPDGVVDTVHAAGGNVSVTQPGTVRVTALHQAASPRYAHPVG